MAAALELSGNPSSVMPRAATPVDWSRRRGIVSPRRWVPSPEMSSLCPLEPRPMHWR